MGTRQRLILFLVVVCGFLASLGASQSIPRMAVRADIRFRFATTEISCAMRNDRETASELTFDMTLPKDAFISNFSMEIEGKSYPGNVRKKQEARQEYLSARQSGHHGALVEQSARHSNKFDVSINIPALSSVTFTLIYQELLRRQFGSYEYSVYMDNKTIAEVQEFSIEVYIQDRNKIHDIRTPVMRKEVLNNEVEENQNSLTQISNPSETTVYVVYKPSHQELMKQGPGWFVVQYDVDSDSAGDLLMVDGYFVHFFMPPDDLPPLPLDIVFVLDISGSMAGRKMDQLKDAMRIILDDLRETDQFSILLFDGTVEHWKPTLQEASGSNIERAQDYVRQIKYRGSTNIHLALMQGLQLLQGSREASRVPMLFFLTDGEATAGEQDSDKIVADVSKQNEGVVNIYSLAFGASADYKLLRQISTGNSGFARKIYEASDAAQQVSGLYREISTIVVRGLTVSYHPTSNNDDGSDHGIQPPLIIVNCTFINSSVLYGRSDFVVAGRLENWESLMPGGGGLKLTVSGLGAKQQINFVLEENDLTQLTLAGDNPFWAVPRDLSKMAERAWAFLMIKQLLKEKVAAVENQDLVKDLDSRILELSLKYHFVTPLTAMVVTRPEDNLKKNTSDAASFTADEDVPAVSAKQVQHHLAAYSSQQTFPRRFASFRHDMMDPNLGRKGQAPGDLLVMSAKDLEPPLHPSHQRGSKEDVLSSASMASTPGPHNTVRRWGPKQERKVKAGKDKKKRERTCISNKRVFLQSVLVRGSKTPVSCYEVKASRSAMYNYTVFADPSSLVSVVATMKRKFLMNVYISKDNETIQVSVSPAGEVVSSPQLPLSDGALQVKEGPLVVSVNVTKSTCKVSFVTISIDLGVADADMTVIKEYKGFVVKAILNAANARRRRNRGKKRKGSGTKGCLSINNVPADRAFVTKGKYLERFKV